MDGLIIILRAMMLEQLRFVRIPVSSLGDATRHAVEVVGLQHAEHLEHCDRFRSDSRRYCLEYDASGAHVRPVVGVSLRTVEQLDDVREKLLERQWRVEPISGDLCRQRRFHAGLACTDLSGNLFELVVRAEDSGERAFTSRDAGLVGLSEITLGSKNPEADAAVWVEVLGANISDRVGAAVYLAWDDRHHRLMLVPGRREDFVVVGFEVESIDAVMQANYYFLERQIGIVHGPGREPASGRVFVTFAGPVPGIYFSFSTRSQPVPAGRWPRQFEDVPSSLCSWGSVSTLAELGGSMQ